MIDYRLLGALALCLILPTAATAAPPLSPTGAWVVDFAPSQCIGTREYGTREKPLLLVFKPSVLGDVMTLAIIRDGKEPEVLQHSVTLKLDQLSPISASLLAFSPKGSNRRAELINLPLEAFAALRRSKSLAIAGAGIRSQSFALQGMIPLMKAMDTCLADLRQVWNVGEVAQSKLKQGPRSKKPLNRYFDADDYPLVAARAEQTGTLAFALLIDENGKIADCTVLATSGVATLDSQSCAIIKERAVFIPAIGADGKPAKSATMQRIRWELP